MGKHKELKCPNDGCRFHGRSTRFEAHVASCTGSLTCLFCHSKDIKTLAGLTKHKKICKY